MASAEKIFILDTNVILHDSDCIYQFEEHDIVIPITVLEELDNFKKGNEPINFHARQFMRAIDSVSTETIFSDGVRLKENLGRIFIKLDVEFHSEVEVNFTRGKPDHHILNIAYHISKENPKSEAILISKDVNLRMKAKAMGLMSDDYKSDQVKNIETLYKGHGLIEGLTTDVIDQMYRDPYEIDADRVSDKSYVANEYFIMKNGRKSALGAYDPNGQKVRHVESVPAYGITPRNAEQTFALDALRNKNIKLVTLTGKAGTGKTLLALAAALEERKFYKQVYLARPVVPLSNKDIGYLPGDIEAKIGPYMQSLYDNLGVIKNQFKEADPNYQRIKQMLDEKKLVIEPLAYIRGRSLDRIYFIVDEAQNLTPHEIKTIITRAGEGTKIVLTGDVFQIDHPYLNAESNGLSYLIEKMSGQGLYAHVNLEKGERSELAELASDLL